MRDGEDGAGRGRRKGYAADGGRGFLEGVSAVRRQVLGVVGDVVGELGDVEERRVGCERGDDGEGAGGNDCDDGEGPAGGVRGGFEGSYEDSSPDCQADESQHRHSSPEP